MAKWVYNFGDGKAAANSCPRIHVIKRLESQVSGQHQLSSSLVSHTSFALGLLPLPGDTGFTRDRLTAALR